MRPNRYESRCRTCGLTVPEGTGWIVARRTGTGFSTWCSAHKADAEAYEQGGNPPSVPAGDPAPLDADAIVAKIAKLSADYATQDVQAMLATVPALVAKEFAALAPRELIIKVGTAPKVVIKQHHKILPTVLNAITAGVSPFLVGPAGSGKTTLGMQVAEALGRKFYMAARVTSEFKLVGFIDATGKCVRTQFREAYEHGGVFLFDEVDASDPDAMTAFNAALANGVADFPDGMVKMHKNFVAIAAGNTYGRGADRQYVGRNQLDAATLDRFVVFDVDYDEQLERAAANNDDWVSYVQRVRHAITAEKVRHIVSPRASIYGARMLAQGMDRKEVEESCIWKGLPATDRSRVEARCA